MNIEERKKQEYMSANELVQMIPKLTYEKALTYIHEVRKEMEEKGYCIPIARPKVALTKLVKKKFGW